MSRGVRDLIDSLGDRKRRSAAPGMAPRGERLPLDPGEDIAAVAQHLDIGAARFVATPRHGFDIDIADLPALLRSTAEHASERGVAAYIQLPGRCLPLTAGLVSERLDDIATRPRFRLLVTGPGSSIVENIAIESWKRSARAYRSLSDDNEVRLNIADLPEPSAGPARTEASFSEPIDVVYTWVDSRDPGWRAMARDYLDLDDLDDDLYTPGDELRYSLRSVEVFAPWVDRIHVLSNCAPPAWFQASDHVRWVDHHEVAEPELLPLFNSGAIDTLLHRIPDLSEHFLYLNDDFLLWDSVTPSTFYDWDGRSIARLAMNSSVIYLQQLVEAGTAAPSQHSRVNAARLLEQRIGLFHSRVHGHVPYALRRSAMEELERAFGAEMAATRSSRTRQPSDVSFIAYLYHHYGHARGRVIYAEAPASFVTFQNYRRPGSRRALHTAAFVCFQDSRGSATDEAYRSFRSQALVTALPLPSMAERPS